jgi:hypothetical protein
VLKRVKARVQVGIAEGGGAQQSRTRARVDQYHHLQQCSMVARARPQQAPARRPASGRHPRRPRRPRRQLSRPPHAPHAQGAEEMGQMEHLLNVYVSRAAKGSCADFLGYCEVSDSEATARMTAGLWLVSAPAGPGGARRLCPPRGCALAAACRAPLHAARRAPGAPPPCAGGTAGRWPAPARCRPQPPPLHRPAAVALRGQPHAVLLPQAPRHRGGAGRGPGRGGGAGGAHRDEADLRQPGGERRAAPRRLPLACCQLQTGPVCVRPSRTRRRRRPHPPRARRRAARRRCTPRGWCTATSSRSTSSSPRPRCASSSSTWAPRRTCGAAPTTGPRSPSWTQTTARRSRCGARSCLAPLPRGCSGLHPWGHPPAAHHPPPPPTTAHRPRSMCCPPTRRTWRRR